MAIDAATILQRLATALSAEGISPEDLPPDEVFALLRSIGVEVDTDQLDRDVRTAVDRIRRSVATGRRPDRALLEQAAQTLTNRIGQGVRSTGKRIVESYALARQATAQPDVTGPLSRYVWLAVMDGRSCPSCEERHGAVRTLQTWDEEGRPGSEVLLCQEHCRCQLWPLQAAGKDVVLQDDLPGGEDTRLEAETAVEDILFRLEGSQADVRVGKGEPLSRAPLDIEAILRSVFFEG